MNNIIDPDTLHSYSIYSDEGKSLLKKYIKLYQNGGSGAAVPQQSLFNQKTISLFQFANFKLNILLMGESHAYIGNIIQGRQFPLTREMIYSIGKYVKSIVDDMNKADNDCCINFYAELDIPEGQNLLKKYEIYHDKSVTFKNIPERLRGGVLGELTIGMYRLGASSENLKTISFDLRRSNLYVGSFIFIAEYKHYKQKPKLHKYGCKFLVDYYKLIEKYKEDKSNEDISNALSLNIKDLQKEGGIDPKLKQIYEDIFNDQQFNEIIDIYWEIITSPIFQTEATQKEWGFSYNTLGWIKNAVIVIGKAKFGKEPTMEQYKLIFKDIILTYYMEASSRILKEYYKCAYPEIQGRISPEKVVDYLKYPFIWMTDMYAFYRFFMKPKDDGGYCKLQKNIILHGGDFHIQNLYSLISNTFNNPYELSRHVFTDRNTERKPLYTLNFVENGRDIKHKHREQISEVLNKSFSRRAEGQQEEFIDQDVSYILILKNDKVVGCLYFCKFPYANKMIQNLKEKHPNIKKGDIYIYNLAIDPNERGQKFCNYLISNGLCFLRKRFSKNMWLIAENPKHPRVSSSTKAANACYSKFMRPEPECKEKSDQQFCYYAVQKLLNPPTLPNFRETITKSPTNPNSLSSHLEHIKESMKQTCENRNYKVINTETCSITGEYPYAVASDSGGGAAAPILADPGGSSSADAVAPGGSRSSSADALGGLTDNDYYDMSLESESDDDDL